ncbi:heparinase II/III-like protein [Plasticicumulans lactativorans]|uniref:Heparinase II/III-like protein n=2 Tax=Plasticicumulans lactativorans TaxID=1133106 RepID=A0A4R2L842_9GAMM|nr:heparinase II/III-like protein [Plasticicumulans lactativorans]
MITIPALGRLARTVVHLRPRQIYWRIRNHWVRIRPDIRPAPALRSPVERWQPSIAGPICMVAPDRFRFLNVEHQVASAADWISPRRDRLWSYNLHYFADLVAVDAASRRDWHRDLIARWLRDNPPGHGTGWEPFCLSLRIVNWLKWYCQGGDLSADARGSLAVQVRYLARSIEWHLLGNHVFENARALMFAGLCFDGPESSEWLETGIQLLDEQIGEQILADGGHFERSPMYHALVLEGVLDLINLMSGHRSDSRLDFLCVRLGNAAQRMLLWLKAMVHPDGEIALFNDAAFGIAPTLAELVDYAARLTIVASAPESGLHLSDSGYVSVRNSLITLIADIGELGPAYQPGHGHADTLSFELSLAGRRVIVDTGTSCYGTSPERLALRRTDAHNTLMVDGQDSSEVWSGFRVGRRAHVYDAIFAADSNRKWVFGACHDGYRYLPGRPRHRRDWVVVDNFIDIVDKVSGDGVHDVAISLLVHPGITVVHAAQDTVELIIDADVRKPLCIIRFAGFDALELRPADYHPEFGKVLSCTRIVLNRRGRLPLEMSTRIEWSLHDKTANP